MVIWYLIYKSEAFPTKILLFRLKKGQKQPKMSKNHVPFIFAIFGTFYHLFPIFLEKMVPESFGVSAVYRSNGQCTKKSGTLFAHFAFFLRLCGL